ncbi:MAG TPA: DoxX family protein [Stellaceae bacterium]|nr:DoxX family protein [Stellaceae bacterium]
MSLTEAHAPGPFVQKMMAVARIVMGGSFLYFGLTKLIAINGIIGYVGTKLPFPTFVFWLAVVIENGLGLLLVLGLKTRWAAGFFVFYCLFTAFVFHTNFASMPMRDHFFSNVVMAAGFLYLLAVGPGAWAMDNKSSAPA